MLLKTCSNIIKEKKREEERENERKKETSLVIILSEKLKSGREKHKKKGFKRF